MKIVNSARVLVSSLALISCSSAVVEALNSYSSGSIIHQRQNVAEAIAVSSSKLDAASLAVSFEEDLALTRQIIMDHQARSVTVSKEQFIQQMEELVKPAEVETIDTGAVDTSVPYDAAARLAYASLEDKSATSFEAFQTQYVADAVALVISKRSKQQGENASPLAINSATNTAEAATSVTQSTKKKSLLRTVVSWVGNKISSN